MFPLVKELLCRGEQPGPSTDLQHVSVGHRSLLSVSFFSFWNIVISFRLLVWPLTVDLYSQCRASMAVCSSFRRPPTHTFVCCLICSLFSLSFIRTHNTHTHKHTQGGITWRIIWKNGKNSLGKKIKLLNNT